MSRRLLRSGAVRLALYLATLCVALASPLALMRATLPVANAAPPAATATPTATTLPTTAPSSTPTVGSTATATSIVRATSSPTLTATSVTRASASPIPSATPTETSAVRFTATPTLALTSTDTPVAASSTPTATETRTPGADFTGIATATPILRTATTTRTAISRRPLINLGSVVGASNYLALNDQSASYVLPLVRTDANDDTIIHVANATGSSTNVTVSLVNQDGSPAQSLGPTSLAAWGSFDVDVATQLNASFLGSATVVASSGAIAVSADVVNLNDSADNVDSYAAMPSNAGLTNGWVPVVLNKIPPGATLASTLYLTNVGTQTTSSVTVTFWSSGNSTPGTVSQTISVGGTTTVSAPNGFLIGPVQVQSDQPLIGVVELTGSGTSGSGIYDITPMVAPVSANPSFFVPRYDYNSDPTTHLDSNLVLLNTSASDSANFTVQFYNPDGTAEGVPINSGPVAPNRTWTVGVLPLSNASNLPSPFTGSARVTTSDATNPSSSISAASMVLNIEGSFGPTSANLSLAANYPVLAVAPSGTLAVAPGLRAAFSGESTGFNLMNAENTTQTYQITYYGLGGNQVEQTSISLGPFQEAYFDQAADSTLGSGFEGSATIADTSGGSLPIVVVGLFAGTNAPPTPLPTIPPSSTATFTPTVTPTVTATSTGVVPYGASMYLAQSEPSTTSYFPLVRTDSRYDTILHLANPTNGSINVTVTFTNADGSPNATVPIALVAASNQDLDVAAQLGTSFNGSATVSASSGSLAASADVLNGTVGSSSTDNFDSYAGIQTAATALTDWMDNGFFAYNSQIDLQNTTNATATVNLNFVVPAGSPTATASVTLAPFGTGQVIVANVPNVPSTKFGVVQITSDQPITALTELTGRNQYGLVPALVPGAPVAGGSTYFPRFDANTGSGPNSALVLQNTGASVDNVTVSFMNPDGTLNTVVTPTIQPGGTALLNAILGSVSLPQGFAGPAVVQSQTGTTSALIWEIQYSNLNVLAIGGYPGLTAAPSGAALDLPGIRFLHNSMSTTYTLMNSSATSETYQITYLNPTGQTVETKSIAVPALGSATYAQNVDNNLSPNQDYFVRVTSSGSLPIGVVYVFGGLLIPATPSPTSTITPTATFTITPTPFPAGFLTYTPTPTPTTVPTDTYEPDDSAAQARPLTLDSVPQSHTISPLGDQDWVTYSVSAGQTVLLQTLNPACDTEINLYDTDGLTLLASDDDSGPGFSASIVYQYPKSGQYYAEIRDYVTIAPTPTDWNLPPNFGTCAYQLVGQFTATGGATFTPTITPTFTPTPSPTKVASTLPPANGVGQYLAGNDQATTFDLPLVRSDGSYDTIVHVVNATTAATTATIVFYDANGNTTQTVSQRLSAFASWDVDATARLGSAFVGSAVVSATNPIAVSADLIDSAAANDNVDSYAGLTGGATSAVLPLVIDLPPSPSIAYDSTIYLQNASDQTAHVTLSFLQKGTAVATPTITLAPHGSANLSAAATLAGLNLPIFLQPVQIQSDQNVAAVSEFAGNGAEGIEPMQSPSGGASSVFVPRYDVSNIPGWNGGIASYNASGASQSFSVSFYDATGALVTTTTSNSATGSLITWLIGLGLSFTQQPALSAGASYSAVVTTQGSSAITVPSGLVSSGGGIPTYAGFSAYPAVSGSPTGGAALVPSIRRMTCQAESTSITLMNTQSTAQTYLITIYSADGAMSMETYVRTLQPFQSTTLDQNQDGNLRPGFEGSAQIVNQTGGAPPLVVARLSAGATGGVQPSSGCGVQPTPTPSGPTTYKLYLPLLPNQGKLP